MTLDYSGEWTPEAREAMRRQHEDDMAERYREMCHREDSEGEAAIEATWRGSWKQQAGHWSSSQHWDGSDGSRVDRKQFGVEAAVADGELAEKYPWMPDLGEAV